MPRRTARAGFRRGAMATSRPRGAHRRRCSNSLTSTPKHVDEVADLITVQMGYVADTRPVVGGVEALELARERRRPADVTCTQEVSAERGDAHAAAVGDDPHADGVPGS